MIKSGYKSCPACDIKLENPVEKVSVDGKKTKVGDGKAPKVKVILREDSQDEDCQPGEDVEGFLFTCLNCEYFWEESK